MGNAEGLKYISRSSEERRNMKEPIFQVLEKSETETRETSTQERKETHWMMLIYYSVSTIRELLSLRHTGKKV